MIYKLLAVDLDGTLLTKFKTITKKDLKALKQYSQKNGEILICTGRSFDNAKKYISTIEKYIGKKLKYVAALCGAAIHTDNNNHISYAPIDYETTKLIIKKTKELGMNFGLYDIDYDNNKVIYINDNCPLIYRLFFRKYSLKKIGNKEKLLPALKINVASLSSKKVKQFIEWANKTLSDKISISNTLKNVFLEIYSKQSSKGIAIEKIANKLNIPLSQTAAIGDSGNDITAFNTVKFSCLLGNNNAKKIACQHFKTKHNGVSRFINKFILNDRNDKAKFLISDLDGTLLNDANKTIDKDVVECINKHIGDKIPFFAISSGRNIIDSYRFLKQLNFSNNIRQFIIANNGALIYDVNNKKVIYTKCIDKKIVFKLINTIIKSYKSKKYGEFGSFIHVFNKRLINTSIKTNLKYLPPMYAINREYMIRGITKNNKSFLTNVPTSNMFELDNANEIKYQVAKILIYFNDQNKCNKFNEIVINKYSSFLSISKSGPSCIEINAKWVNKGNGVKKVCKKMKCSPLEAIICGDENNDISMLKLSNWSFTLKKSNNNVKNSSIYNLDSKCSTIVKQALTLYDKMWGKK